MPVAGIPTLRWPLSIRPDGMFDQPSNLSEGWAQRITALLSTRPVERMMRSSYGCSLADEVFGAMPSEMADKEVRRAVGVWLPRLSVLSVSVAHSSDSYVRVALVSVAYQTPGGTEEEIALSFSTPVEGTQ